MKHYKTLIYKLWCLISKLELRLYHHGQRIGAMR